MIALVFLPPPPPTGEPPRRIIARSVWPALRWLTAVLLACGMAFMSARVLP